MCSPSRQSSIAADSLESYKNTIESTTDNLEAHLESINVNLKKIVGKNALGSSTDNLPPELEGIGSLGVEALLSIAPLDSRINAVIIAFHSSFFYFSLLPYNHYRPVFIPKATSFGFVIANFRLGYTEH
jgi:hypothetical protein